MTESQADARLPRVAVIGLRGYGVRHVRLATQLHQQNEIVFAAGCDLAQVEDAGLPGGAVQYTDHRAMLAEVAPDITTIATPPHTHFALAADAIRAGCDVLVEKPPVVSLEQHRELIKLAAAHGRTCQVGFQSLSSPALARLLDAITAGKLGRITNIAASGAWIRTDCYYARSPWAGHRRIGDTVVADGAATNPFAHAVMNALVIAETVAPDERLSSLEAEAYRCREIRTDDTMCARLRIGTELTVTIALTLCAEESETPHVTVHGAEGTARLYYTLGSLLLPGDSAPVQAPDGPSLLANLVRHRRDPGVPLFARLEQTLPFTAFAEAMLTADDPTAVGAEFLTERVERDDPAKPVDRRVILTGVNAAIARARDEKALFSELSVPWAVAPARVAIQL